MFHSVGSRSLPIALGYHNLLKSGLHWPHSQILSRLKSFRRTNTLAYFAATAVTDKSFTILDPGPKVIKLFPSVIYEFL
jgi:hypothetical protein